MQCQKLKTYMETGRVVFLPESSIRPNPAQPRKVFRDDALDELADSIRQHGILQPLSVRRMGTGYELIAGERRLRAARIAGVTDIPCIIMRMDEKESGMAALIENLQRQDLDFIEEAQGIRRLLDCHGMSQEQAARLLGKSQSAVANKLRLLKLSPTMLEALRSGGLTERHGRALLRVPEQQRKEVLAHIVREKLNVAQTDEYIDQLLSPPPPKPVKRPKPKIYIRDIRLFLNTLRRGMDLMQRSGLQTSCAQVEDEDSLTLTITIPKRKTGK
jgi:ParB family chromosome partitioning protein